MEVQGHSSNGIAKIVPVSLNMSIDTDPQQQEAASPRMLVVRSSLR